MRDIGDEGAWTFSLELFRWRNFRNRREVGAVLGLTPLPFSSGSDHSAATVSTSSNASRELAYVEFGGEANGRATRLEEIRKLSYNDLAADRQTVAAVQALEAILTHAANGEPDCVVRVNGSHGGLVLYRPGNSEPEVLYAPKV